MVEKYQLIKTGSLYQILKSNDAETPRKILYSTNSDFSDLKELEGVDFINLTFESPSESKLYLKLELSGSDYYLALRTLDIDGLINFRDIGGYFNRDNRQVKWGLLYRSDQPYNASAAGFEKILNLGINSIFDYRSPDEVNKYPNPHFEHAKTYNINPHAHTAELSAQFSAPAEEEDEILVNEMLENRDTDKSESIIEQYEGFVNNDKAKKAFSKLIKIAAVEGSAPILHHCRGGKDRTGFGALLLLGILGVDDETIVYDYMLTRENRKERNEIKMNKYRKYTDDKAILSQLLSLIDTEERFIKSALNIINEKYGNIEAYAKIELDISDAEIKSLRKMYLY